MRDKTLQELLPLSPSVVEAGYGSGQGCDVDVSDLNTGTLPGISALAPCLHPSEGEQEPNELKTLHYFPE